MKQTPPKQAPLKKRRQKATVDPRIAGLRYSNTQGKIIPLHHAFLTVNMNRFSRNTAIIMPAIFLLIIWLFLPSVMQIWSDVFAFWMSRIYEGGTVAHETVRLLGRELSMPFPLLVAEKPSEHLVYTNLIVCAIAFLLSFLVPARIAPINYLLRAVILIQASASLDRIISPDYFPYTMQIYMVDALTLSIYLIFLLPLVLGFVYYIFDFGLLRKIILTVMMLAYYFLTIPCQYMLHAYIVHEGTLLFLPIMYLMFGTLLNVLMFVSIYSFGMSWRSNNKTMNGRGL